MSAMLMKSPCVAWKRWTDMIFQPLGIKEPIRISIGLAHADGIHAESLATLQKQADVAMYYAKRPGHGKIALYAEDMAHDGNALLSNRITNAVFEGVTSGFWP